MWNPKYPVAYHVVCVMGKQLELAGKCGKTQEVNVQDVKITYPVDEMIKCLPDKKLWDMQPIILHIQN